MISSDSDTDFEENRAHLLTQSLLKKERNKRRYYISLDERTKDMWPNFGMLVTILVTYVYFCKRAGPAWMKDRKPFDLTNVIFYYNIFQIVVSFYIFYEGFGIWWNDYNWTCQPLIQGDTPLTRKINHLVWMYTNLKLVELVETIIFVLRKKARQISTLHVYHHVLMPICGFIGLKYYPTGHSSPLGVINSFVHTIMYTYYLISGLGPQYHKYLWWKRQVTMLQLIQFVIVFVLNLLPLINGCDYPKWVNVAICVCSLQFVYMFGNFYYKNYIKTPQVLSNGSAKKIK